LEPVRKREELRLTPAKEENGKIHPGAGAGTLLPTDLKNGRDLRPYWLPPMLKKNAHKRGRERKWRSHQYRSSRPSLKPNVKMGKDTGLNARQQV